MHEILQYILHIDTLLISFISTYGAWTYAALFLIIFCETGLVVTPFLPGDSLLFAAGSIAANSNDLMNIQLLFVLLITASILGNKLNYLIGMAIGPKVFGMKDSWLLNKNHLDNAHQFYEKHGGKTIILARFVPIVRTFAPFVAGVSYMTVKRFTLYNILSAFLWVGSLLGAGYFLGSHPLVKENFSIMVYAIVLFSILPPIIGFLYRKYRTKKSS